MMVSRDPIEAVARVPDGAVVMVGGWGGIGVPRTLLTALANSPVSELTIVANNCGMGEPDDVGCLFEAGKVKRVIASFPSHPAALAFRSALKDGSVELELVPQGTLVERIRSAGVGIGGFFTPTGVGTDLVNGKEVRQLDGRLQVFEHALHADVALIHAAVADHHGNLRYRHVGRAFNAVMAMAAKHTIAEVDGLVDRMNPDHVHTPALLVDDIIDLGMPK